MVNNPNIRAPLRLPRPSNEDVASPEAMKAFLDAAFRSIEQSINNLADPNNQTWVITNQTTASRASLSISGNTVDQDKIRDNFVTLLNVLKNNRRIN